MEKKRAYEQRVREIEHASFTPFFSASGGLAKEATNFYKRLASKLAEKWDHSYSLTINWLRCTLSFSLLRSAIQCVRGAPSTRGRAVTASFSPIDLVSAEANFRPCQIPFFTYLSHSLSQLLCTVTILFSYFPFSLTFDLARYLFCFCFCCILLEICY